MSRTSLRNTSDPAPASGVAPRAAGPSTLPPSASSVEQRVELGVNVIHVTLQGLLPLHWLGQLGSALSRRGIGIDGVDAERDPSGRWKAVVHVRTGDADDLHKLDYVALCEVQTPDSSDPRCPRLTCFELTRTSAGLLELCVEGPDQLGFLSALFARLGFLGLFADRIHAVTHGDSIDDLLLLRGVGGVAPSEATEKALRQTLSRLTVNPAKYQVVRPSRRVLRERS